MAGEGALLGLWPLRLAGAERLARAGRRVRLLSLLRTSLPAPCGQEAAHTAMARGPLPPTWIFFKHHGKAFARGCGAAVVPYMKEHVASGVGAADKAERPRGVPADD